MSIPTETASAYGLYLREVGKTALLTAQEELALARKIRKGNKAAREHMIKANLRLVIKIAHEYDGYGLPLLDLINEGNIGLMKAIDRFDPERGAKLSTYAVWWIRQTIQRAISNQSKTIRLPVHLNDQLFKLRRTALELQEKLGHEPSNAEIAQAMGVSERQVKNWRGAAFAPISLDTPVGDEDNANLGDLVPDNNAVMPFEAMQDAGEASIVQDLLKTLPTRERQILAYRFGLNGGKERTLEEVGERFGVTRERIRQLQNKALSRLRKAMEQFGATPATA
jgi:RNA polymerase primary sigma factor